MLKRKIHLVKYAAGVPASQVFNRVKIKNRDFEFKLKLRKGIKYMKLAGYNPQGMVRMLEALQEYDRKQPIRPKYYGRTHPYVHERIASAHRTITGDLSFRDWVRLTGEREDYKK